MLSFMDSGVFQYSTLNELFSKLLFFVYSFGDYITLIKDYTRTILGYKIHTQNK